MQHTFDFRRVVSWAAHWLARGDTDEQLIERNRKRKPPLNEEDVIRAIPFARQACANVRRLHECDPTTRVCDVTGCVFPEGE